VSNEGGFTKFTRRVSWETADGSPRTSVLRHYPESVSCEHAWQKSGRYVGMTRVPGFVLACKKCGVTAWPPNAEARS
jgi:hypothetical protein